MSSSEQQIEIAGKSYSSRLIIGNDKYKDFNRNLATLGTSSKLLIAICSGEIGCVAPALHLQSVEPSFKQG